MTPVVKFLIGLVAVMGMGWISHGPLGGGEAMLDRVEDDAQAAVSRTQVPVQVPRTSGSRPAGGARGGGAVEQAASSTAITSRPARRKVIESNILAREGT